MRKFSLYFACFFTLVLMGCGDTSGDPTAQITLKADKTEVSPGGSAVITATVVKAVGTKADATAEATVTAPGWGENVTFKLLTANGGQLSAPIQKTDGNGVAMTVYTAGNNYSNDTIQATLDNGMTASIVITKTGDITGARISKLEGPPSSVAEGQTAVITATVTNKVTDQPMMGEAVTFTIPTNGSGACFINEANACVTGVTVNSDAGGKAVAVYKAGGYASTIDVYDTVRASLANGSSNAVVITRKAPTLFSIMVVASTSPVNAGQVSIVTATLTGDNNAGVTVTFTLPVNNSGATLSASTATTDGTGKAVVTYTAGANNPTLTVSDSVQAAVGTATGAVAITRTGTGAPLSIAVAASPASVNAGQVSIVTATLTGVNNAGVTVTFTLPVNNSGATLSTTTAITDGDGKAIAIYQPGANNPTIDVQDTVQAAVGSATGAFVITRIGTATSAYRITVTALPNPLSAVGGNSTITANVTNNAGTALSGLTVDFTQTGGISVLPASAITDGNGKAVSVFKGGGVAGGTAGIVTASITIGGNTYQATVVITNP